LPHGHRDDDGEHAWGEELPCQSARLKVRPAYDARTLHRDAGRQPARNEKNQKLKRSPDPHRSLRLRAGTEPSRPFRPALTRDPTGARIRDFAVELRAHAPTRAGARTWEAELLEAPKRARAPARARADLALPSGRTIE
jgi:hypothetical protein